MPWEATKDSEILAIHAALVPTDTGDGEIIYFGGDQHDASRLNDVDASRRYNCRTGAISYVKSPTSDVFCCGHASLIDGRLLVAGGTSLWGGGEHAEHGHMSERHFRGHRRAWVYSPWTKAFSEIASMLSESAQETSGAGGGRWYPTLVTLGNGQVLAMSGHPLNNDHRHNNNTPERYLLAVNAWIPLPAFGSPAAVNLYPRLHLLPNGEVFISSAIAGRSKNISYNPWNGTATEIGNLPNPRYHFVDEPSVLLPLLAGEGYTPRVLLCGGETPQKINLATPSPEWKNAGIRNGSAAGKLRQFACAVILPTTEVLLTGGVSVTKPEIGVMEPELYNPAIVWDTAGARYKDNGTDTWNTIEEPATVVRNYHSTALLMPDGRVWTAGSSKNAQPGHPANSRLSIEIFTPPYAAGLRPTISDCPTIIVYGQIFGVRTSQAASIQRIAFIHCGSVTHAYDSDQRYIDLRFTRDGDRLDVVAPPHRDIAPPGYYMLFLVDSENRPCQRARFVQMCGQVIHVTAAANPQGDLHLCILDQLGKIQHTIRQADERWPFPFGDVHAHTDRVGATIRQIACAMNPQGALHVCVIDHAGGIWHTIRQADGQWPFPFGDVQAQTGRVGATIRQIACAVNPQGALHVCVIDHAGGIWHTIRQADGQWPFPFDQVGGNLGAIRQIACAVNPQGALHVCVINHAGGVWHTIRQADGQWPFPFSQVGGDLGAIRQIACAVNPQGALHVCVIDHAGGIWHTIRQADGQWPFPFGDVKSAIKPTHLTTYRITVVTGSVSGAGTDANVHITLFGEHGNSAERLLANAENNFEKARTDVFGLEMADIGIINRIRIRHDNKGEKPRWFLDVIVVQKKDRNEEWVFPCHQWLARDAGDRLDRVLDRITCYS